MADNMLARIQNQVVHTRNPSLDFMNWAHVCTTIVLVRSYMLNILHRGFIITSNDKRIVSFIVPVLITLMQVKYQSVDKTPFITHSKTMNGAVFSILMYSYFAYGAKLRFDLHGNPPTYAFHFMVLFGNMAVASLASIFFSDSIRPVLYLLCVLISAGEWLYGVYNRDEQIFWRKISGFLINIWKWLLAYFSAENTDILHDRQFTVEIV
ncbi:Hypothetical predicted protein [Olea europaea subsp. europaea]|uniref:Uncharacterized protein n=1 Tax=Olea europaea subsp. europaea TaxID=158383 RepID=A0A8S0RGD9_OLEEU|nr:Hypothetical predicted protein [Olea europaea subsp. europaea]